MKQGGPIWALGMMSGTSLDGVDAAMIRTDGATIFEFGPYDYRPYTDAERAVLRAALGKWQGEAGVAQAAEVVEAAHIDLAARFSGADVIGFHGQTLAHDPANGRTHQAGDGGVLATALRLPVVWDFRSADVAMGGQGAPLVPYFHHACARFIGADTPLMMLNLGGVGNVTWIDPNVTRPDSEGAVLAFDTGPANAPINDLMLARRGLAQDEGGALAQTGAVDHGIVDAFLRHSYFARVPPKSLDRDAFSIALHALDHLNDADAVATATAIAAASVGAGLQHFAQTPSQLLVAGGGRHNFAMMKQLGNYLKLPVQPIEFVKLNGDMLEAQAFGYLALRVMRGLPTSGPSTTGAPAHISGGQISRPD
ncbi:MAG: anhydro-N-acetylmuramic acid kinase [Cypionkella sp.]|nr:anhydro-N-acetylmuramic acid kinase [Cypionkella sp.]